MKKLVFGLLLGASMISCAQMKGVKEFTEKEKQELGERSPNIVETSVGKLELPAPFNTKSIQKVSKVVGWKNGEMPTAPEGFKVEKFADGFEHPRWTYVAPNKDVFVVESNTRNSANRITIIRDADFDGVIEHRGVFKGELNQPFGMLVLGDYFYIANTDGLYRYAYKEGDLELSGKGEKIVDLPAGGYNNHWTRNLIASKDGSKIYISVGSASNVGEYGMDKEVRRAGILEIDPDGSNEKIYASGLRNPVGMDWNPVTNELWTAVNERDMLGNNLVPDYITSVKEGGWYGWPYSYYGQIKDPRWEDAPHNELVEKAIIPDASVGPHTASLGFTFYSHDAFPEKYKNGAFVGQHGSWNRDPLSGYKVMFVPFVNGQPQEPKDFLTGFIANEEAGEVHGRPVGVTTLPDGSLLVNDDDSNVIWKVSVE
tara:strand:+ start:174 stop:1454 length:1281 start_codon:yes stop_codon:yes gene_type:complete